MKVVLGSVLLIALSGCASTQGKFVFAEDAVHDNLAAVDDKVRSICSGAAGQVPPVRQACVDVRPILLSSLQAGDTFNRAVAAQKIPALLPLIESIGKLTAQIKLLPEGDVAALIRRLLDALAAARQEVIQ